MSEIIVYTFNILTSAFANTESYPNVDKKALKDAHRWRYIKERINKMMGEEAIILLQEVSEFHCSRLITFAIQNNYRCIHTNYNNVYTGFMGTVTLFPTKYNLLETKFFRPASLVKSMLPFSKTKTTYSWYFWSTTCTEESYYEILGKRPNVLIMVRLSIDDKVFCVANYHAPCVYWKKYMTDASTLLTLHSVNTFAKEDPVIFGGDFNLTPESLSYDIITTGRFDDKKSDPELGEYAERMRLTNLFSSYKQVNGSEPEFTCHSELKTRYNEEISKFKDTIDYIFFRNLTPVESVVLPNIHQLLPCDSHPSDHKYIRSSFKI